MGAQSSASFSRDLGDRFQLITQGERTAHSPPLYGIPIPGLTENAIALSRGCGVQLRRESMRPEMLFDAAHAMGELISTLTVLPFISG